MWEQLGWWCHKACSVFFSPYHMCGVLGQTETAQQARGEWTCWTAASTGAAGMFGLALLQRQRNKDFAPVQRVSICA